MADVIFIHGPGGDAYGTWQHGVGLEAWWPSWIAGDSKRVGVWSLDYDAAPSVWLGRAMRTVDRANNVLALLDAEGFGKRPLFLVVIASVVLLRNNFCAQQMDTGQELGAYR